MITIKQIVRYSLFIQVAFLSACSTGYDDYVYQKSPQTYNLPEIPEIATPPAPRYTPPTVVQPKVQQSGYQPKVQKYVPTNAPSTEVTQEEVAAVMEKKEQEAMKRAEVDTDPYANIPDSSAAPKPAPVVKAPVIVSSNKPKLGTIKPVKPPAAPSVPRDSSSAVRSLLLKARADLAIGRTTSAISKLERGLRIEPQNAELWYQLAKAQYSKKHYNQTVTMAKKSIRYTNREYIIAKNWILIKKAGKKSGDTVVVKEAIDYFKINP